MIESREVPTNSGSDVGRDHGCHLELRAHVTREGSKRRALSDRGIVEYVVPEVQIQALIRAQTQEHALAAALSRAETHQAVTTAACECAPSPTCLWSLTCYA